MALKNWESLSIYGADLDEKFDVVKFPDDMIRHAYIVNDVDLAGTGILPGTILESTWTPSIPFTKGINLHVLELSADASSSNSKPVVDGNAVIFPRLDRLKLQIDDATEDVPADNLIGIVTETWPKYRRMKLVLVSIKGNGFCDQPYRPARSLPTPLDLANLKMFHTLFNFN